MYTFSFEKLDAWIEAKELTKVVYHLTKSFSEGEKYGMTSQLRRACVSICSNLAEGSSRTSYKDKAHFTTIAFGSTIEVLNQLILCFELGIISSEEYTEGRNQVERVSNKKNSLRKFQLSKLQS